MAGLLDSVFDPATYAGLLGAFKQQQQPIYSGPQQIPAVGSWPESPSGVYRQGDVDVPVYGQAPSQPEISAQSRMPQSVQQQAAPQSVPSLNAADRFKSGVDGFVENLHTGPVGALVGGLAGLAGGENTTTKVLRARGIDEDTIAAARKNPAIMAVAVQQAYGTKDLTNDIKEYQYAISQGYKGKFLDFVTAMKQAGAIQNNVMIDQKGEAEFSKEAGKLQAGRFNDIASDGAAARQMISDVEMLRDLGAKIQTGKGAEVRAAIGPYAQALGVDIKGLDEIQAFEAIVNRVAPNLRVKGSGAQSDYELRNFLKSIPALGNTPGGNEIVAKTLQGLSENKVAASDIAARALAKEITPREAEKMLRELPDPMAGWRQANKGGGAASKVRTYNPQTGRIE